MRERENRIIQRRVSLTVAFIGLIVSLTNFFRITFFRGESFTRALSDPSFFCVFGFSLLLFLTRKIESRLIQYLQILVFLANAALALLDEYDAFHGMGFIILSLLLAYRYRLLEKHPRIKLGALALFSLFFLEYSIHLSGDDQIGSSLNIIVFLAFFLSIIYLVYMSEINHILRIEKVFRDSRSSLNEERNRIMEEIEIRRQEIEERESRVRELEEKIAQHKGPVRPLDLKRRYGITRREEDVIREFCRNPHLTTKEIAFNLDMSLGTVKQHFNKIFKKMEVRSRPELLAKCRSRLHLK